MSNWQYSSNGLDDGMAPSRWAAIIWTNDVLCCRRIYVSLGINELREYTYHALFWLRQGWLRQHNVKIVQYCQIKYLSNAKPHCIYIVHHSISYYSSSLQKKIPKILQMHCIVFQFHCEPNPFRKFIMSPYIYECQIPLSVLYQLMLVTLPGFAWQCWSTIKISIQFIVGTGWDCCRKQAVGWG